VEPVIGLLSAGKINVDHLITHCLPFEKTKEAFDLVAGYRESVIKALIAVE
jgi:threonine dehydrogenase-like Zn-dependent dehydrogenase